MLDFFNESFYVEYRQSIIFTQSASQNEYISANLLLPEAGVP